MSDEDQRSAEAEGTKCRNPMCDEYTGNPYIFYCSQWSCQLFRGLMATCATQTKTRYELERDLVPPSQIEAAREYDDDEMIVRNPKKKKVVVEKEDAKPVNVKPSRIGDGHDDEEMIARNPKNKRVVVEKEDAPPVNVQPPSRVEAVQDYDDDEMLRVPKKKRPVVDKLMVTKIEPQEKPIPQVSIPVVHEPIVSQPEAPPPANKVDEPFKIPKKTREASNHGAYQIPKKPRIERKPDEAGPRLTKPSGAAPSIFERRNFNHVQVSAQNNTQQDAMKSEIIYQPDDGQNNRTTNESNLQSRANGPSKFTLGEDMHRKPPQIPVAAPASREIPPIQNPNRAFLRVTFLGDIQPASKNLPRVYQPQSILKVSGPTAPNPSPPNQPPIVERKIAFSEYRSRFTSKAPAEEIDDQRGKERPRDPRDPRLRRLQGMAEPSLPPQQKQPADRSLSDAMRDTHISQPKQNSADPISSPPRDSNEGEQNPNSSPDENDMDVEDFIQTTTSRYAQRVKTNQSTQIQESQDAIVEEENSRNPLEGSYVDEDMDIAEDLQELDSTSPIACDLTEVHAIVWLFSERLNAMLVNMKAPLTKRYNNLQYFDSLKAEINALDQYPTKIQISETKQPGNGNTVSLTINGRLWLTITMHGTREAPLRILLSEMYEQCWVWHTIIRNVKLGGLQTLERVLQKTSYHELRRDIQDEGSFVQDDGMVFYYKCIFRLQIGSGTHENYDESRRLCYDDAFSKLKEIAEKIDHMYTPLYPLANTSIPAPAPSQENKLPSNSDENVIPIPQADQNTSKTGDDESDDDDAPVIRTEILARLPDQCSDTDDDY